MGFDCEDLEWECGWESGEEAGGVHVAAYTMEEAPYPIGAPIL